jgi:hypothetical protein
MDVPPGESEYDYAGGIRGEPYEVILGEHTKLPIPAYSEVAVEGEVIPGTKIPEGPFGEFTGYYAGGLRSEPVLKVKRLMYRNNPIITGAPPYRPSPGAENNLIRAAYICTVNLFSILHYSRSSRVSRTGIVGHAQVVKEQASVSVELADFLSDVFDTLGFDQADGKAA